MRNAEHHIHKRKRIHQLKQEYPHPKIKLLDNIVLGTSIVSPLTAVPQVYKIWFLQNTQGVSLLSWALFAVFAIPMLTYGIIHKYKPIIVLNVLWLIVHGFVISGIILYG